MEVRKGSWFVIVIGMAGLLEIVGIDEKEKVGGFVVVVAVVVVGNILEMNNCSCSCEGRWVVVDH